MTYCQISTVNYEHITRKQIQWLNKQEPDLFVLVTDGDESMQYDFDSIPLTLDEVLLDISEGERINFGEKPDPIPECLIEVKSYWSTDYTFERKPLV